MVDWRIKNVLNVLKNENSPIKASDLANRVGLSNRTLRDIFHNIPQNNDAFIVEFSKGLGYELRITNEEAFYVYMENLPIFYNPTQRLEAMLFYLLQEEGYSTILGLEEKLAISRSTVLRELREVEEVLARFNLKLERRARLGIRVCGSEEDLRQAFSQYVLGSVWYLEPTTNYGKFIEALNKNVLNDVLKEGISQTGLSVSNIAFDNIIVHLTILAYRIHKRNFIQPTTFRNRISDKHRELAKFLVSWVEKEYGMSLPDSEEDFLATQISSKASVTELEMKEKTLLFENIDSMLTQLDKEFLTQFSDDKDLRESLLLHLLPTLHKHYQDFKLSNPLIEETYTKYANIFMVGLRFAHLIEDIYRFTASRDEIGYLTLHFATHFERLRQKLFKSVKRIVVICTTGGGSAHLLRLKLQEIFNQSTIITTAQSNLNDFSEDLPDIFLSTVPLGDEYMGVPIVHIKEFLNEEELQKIRDAAYLRLSGTSQPNIADCFYEQFFQRTKGDYLDIIRRQSQLMVESGFASSDFTQLVLEREERFTTIYANGIAGPHSMKLNAIKNCIGVTILEDRARYKGKGVQLIFLINLMPGHLFLHKEVSRLMLHLIENEGVKKKLINAKDFKRFMREFSKLI